MWKSPETGVEYTDMSYPISGKEITGLLEKNAQESALVIKKDGTWELLYA